MLEKVTSFFIKQTPVNSAIRLEQKDNQPFSPFMSFVNYLALNGWSNLSAYQAMQYYMQVAPLSDAIKRIFEECSSIRWYVQNLKTEKFEKDHQVLDLIRHPNTDMIGSEFLEQLIAYYLITGNAYIIATGKPEKAPLELFVISPEYVTLIPDSRDGYTQTINYISSTKNIAFERATVKGRFRYYSLDKNQEIYHIRMFNPIRGITNNYGLSPLAPIFYEIEQYIKASLHNLSLLNRGGRPTGALTTSETLSDSSFARLQEQMDRFYAGPENAGRLMILDNGLKFQEMALSMKDMDFEKLKNNLTHQIYSMFKIPIAFIDAASMSYNNLETARLMFYDFAVLPMMRRILEELSNFLMYRYDEQAKSHLVYNKDDIPALQIRRNEELTMVKNLGVNTINEIRALKGDKPARGGDDIYGSAASFPVATVSTREQEEETENDEIEEADALKVDYFMRMRKLKDRRGLPAFTEQEIKEKAIEYGIIDK